jgi:hypothetical protein
VSDVNLSPAELQALYVLLKPRESTLRPPMPDLLRRIEKDLFGRLTIEEIEALQARSAEER